METTSVLNEIETLIRQSEVMAVVRAVRSGQPPRLGSVVDYQIEGPGASRNCGFKAKPYRVAVEQWHLDAAQRVLAGRQSGARLI